MSKKSLDSLTETMFYVLMAFYRDDMCGTELTGYIKELTGGRVSMGPGTLYTILSRFTEEELIRETSRSGRKITYAITDSGRELYKKELARLRSCIEDAERVNNERNN